MTFEKNRKSLSRKWYLASVHYQRIPQVVDSVSKKLYIFVDSFKFNSRVLNITSARYSILHVPIMYQEFSIHG